MDSESLRLLLIEDNPVDACVIREHLAHANEVHIELEHVDRLSAGLARLTDGRFDGALVDLTLPDSSSLETLTRVRNHSPRIPIVVLTGLNPQEFGLRAMKAGAEDYLAKDDLEPKVLLRTIRYAIERAGRRRAEQEYRDCAEKTLRESEQRYRRLLQAVTSYTYSVTFADGASFTHHGLGCLATTGYGPDEYAADFYLWIRIVHAADRERVTQHVTGILRGETLPPIEHRILHKDGSTRWIRNTIIHRYDERGRLSGYDGVVEDITERKQAEQELRERESHLLAAEAIQARLWPKAPPALPGFDIAGVVYPAQFAAGDYFDYIPMPDGSVGFVIGDVAGHGLGPSIVMALTYAHLRSLLQIYNDIPDVLTRLNQFLINETDHFVTLLFGRLVPGARSFAAVNAGHPPGYVIDRSGRIKAQVQSTTLPLAVWPDAEFSCCDPVTLEPGDVVLLFTDGIPEARSPEGAVFGNSRLLEAVCANLDRPAAEIIAAIYRAVQEFCGYGKPCDDITMIVIKVEDEEAVLNSFSGGGTP